MSPAEIHPQVRLVVKPYASALPLGVLRLRNRGGVGGGRTWERAGGRLALAIFVLAMYG